MRCEKKVKSAMLSIAKPKPSDEFAFPIIPEVF
jgi:hypothetical protein